MSLKLNLKHSLCLCYKQCIWIFLFCISLRLYKIIAFLFRFCTILNLEPCCWNEICSFLQDLVETIPSEKNWLSRSVWQNRPVQIATILEICYRICTSFLHEYEHLYVTERLLCNDSMRFAQIQMNGHLNTHNVYCTCPVRWRWRKETTPLSRKTKKG